MIEDDWSDEDRRAREVDEFSWMDDDDADTPEIDLSGLKEQSSAEMTTAVLVRAAARGKIDD